VSTYTLTNVTANHTISASFALITYTISASEGVGGNISPSGSVSVTSGSDGSFTITPNSGYTISSVVVDGTSVGAVSTYTLTTVTANHTISASFALITYTISASEGVGGTTSPSGSVSVAHGTNHTFSITPDSGYQISDVVVDGTSIGAVSTYTLTNVTANHTISASFALITYTISASEGVGGSITPSGVVSVNAGANQTFTVTPNPGYRVSKVFVDGLFVGAVSSYTFSNVAANHTISVRYWRSYRRYSQ
jgi:hypothetical protein